MTYVFSLFLCFGKLTLQGRCCRICQLTLLCPFTCRERLALAPCLLVPSQRSKVRHTRPLLPYHVRRSRNLVRRLPFERGTVVNMQMFAYVQPYLFRIVHVFWTACGCVDGVSFHAPPYPRQSFDITSLLFSGYTISLPGRVFGEQRGGAVEILSRIGVEHGNCPYLHILGWD